MKKKNKKSEKPAVPQGLPTEIWVWRYPPDETCLRASAKKSDAFETYVTHWSPFRAGPEGRLVGRYVLQQSGHATHKVNWSERPEVSDE